MKYYQRHIKIMKTSNKKNYPLSKLLFNYTGDEYEKLNFKGTYNNLTPNECTKAFSNSLYKYSDDFIQTDNIIEMTNHNEYKEKLKNILDKYRSIHGSYMQQNNLTEPDPFNLHNLGIPNKHENFTEYYNSTKHEMFIGLYKYNENTKQYQFIFDSFYDEETQMYYLFIKN